MEKLPDFVEQKEKKNKKRLRTIRAMIWGGIFWLVVLGILGYHLVLLVPAGSDKLYFVYTRYNGYQDLILQPKQYYISWQNILPGNVELVAISNQVRKLDLNKTIRLPSAKNYELLLPKLTGRKTGLNDSQDGIQAGPKNEQDDFQNPFEFQVGLVLGYRYRPEKLLALVRASENFLVSEVASEISETSRTSEPFLPVENETGKEVKEIRANESFSKTLPSELNITEFTLRLENKLRQRLIEELEILVRTADVKEKESNIFSASSALESFLKSTFAHEFPELEFLFGDVYRYHSPDLELYNRIKQRYQTLLQELSRQSLFTLLEQQKQQQIHERSQELYLQNIERLGEILSKHPLLIDYLSLQGKTAETILPIKPTRELNPKKPIPKSTEEEKELKLLNLDDILELLNRDEAK